MRDSAKQARGATVFACWVDDPERYGIIEFDASHRPLRIVEKPKAPKSNYAVTGLYFYDERVVDVVREMKPSARGELEITDLNQWYLEHGELHVERFGRGYAWLDAGTHESLLEASQFIHIVEKRQGLKIACPEEVAFIQGFIDAEQLLRLAEPLKGTAYGQYLIRQAVLQPSAPTLARDRVDQSGAKRLARQRAGDQRDNEQPERAFNAKRVSPVPGANTGSPRRSTSAETPVTISTPRTADAEMGVSGSRAGVKNSTPDWTIRSLDTNAMAVPRGPRRGIRMIDKSRKIASCSDLVRSRRVPRLL